MPAGQYRHTGETFEGWEIAQIRDPIVTGPGHNALVPAIDGYLEFGELAKSVSGRIRSALEVAVAAHEGVAAEASQQHLRSLMLPGDTAWAEGRLASNAVQEQADHHVRARDDVARLADPALWEHALGILSPAPGRRQEAQAAAMLYQTNSNTNLDRGFQIFEPPPENVIGLAPAAATGGQGGVYGNPDAPTAAGTPGAGTAGAAPAGAAGGVTQPGSAAPGAMAAGAAAGSGGGGMSGAGTGGTPAPGGGVSGAGGAGAGGPIPGVAGAGPGQGGAAAGPGRGGAAAGPGQGPAAAGPGRGGAATAPGRGGAAPGAGGIAVPGRTAGAGTGAGWLGRAPDGLPGAPVSGSPRPGGPTFGGDLGESTARPGWRDVVAANPARPDTTAGARPDATPGARPATPTGPGVPGGTGTSTGTAAGAGQSARGGTGMHGMPMMGGAGGAGGGAEGHRRPSWLLLDDPQEFWFRGMPEHTEPVIGGDDRAL